MGGILKKSHGVQVAVEGMQQARGEASVEVGKRSAAFHQWNFCPGQPSRYQNTKEKNQEIAQEFDTYILDGSIHAENLS